MVKEKEKNESGKGERLEGKGREGGEEGAKEFY
jgi:hypothetical protein